MSYYGIIISMLPPEMTNVLKSSFGETEKKKVWYLALVIQAGWQYLQNLLGKLPGNQSPDCPDSNDN